MSRSWSLNFGRLSRFAPPHLVERYAPVGGVLTGKVQDPLADHVARHLCGAAPDAGDLAAHIPSADVEQPRLIVDHGRRTGDRVGGVGLDVVGLGHVQPDDRSGGGRQGSAGHGVEDVLAELSVHRAVDQGPADYLPHAFTRTLVGAIDQRHQVDRNIFGLSDSGSAGVFRAVAHGAALVVELPRRHLPAFARLPDDSVVAQFDIVEEFLAELNRAVDLANAIDRHSGVAKWHQKHRQPVVFRCVPIGPGQAQTIVGGERPGAPCLGAVDDPASVAAVGAGDDAREVGAPAGFGQQLYEHFIAAQRRRDVSAFLLLAAHVEDRRAANGEGRDVEEQRRLVGKGLGVERLLVLVAQSESAVLSRKADSGESPVVQPLLQFTGALPGRQCVALEDHRVVGIQPWYVLGQPGPGPAPEFFDGLGSHDRYRPPVFSCTAARMSAFNAFSSIVSPSWKSMARLVLPSRLKLNMPEGSSTEAPLAKVTFTTFLYVSTVQIIPS